MEMTPIRRIIATTIHCHYLLRLPVNNSVPLGVLVGFHGYALNAEENMRKLLEIPGINDWMVCSVQALHRFYNSKTQEIGASWMTHEDRDLMIRDNVEFIEEILEDIDLEYPERDVDDCLVYAGFSQGASMAYRAAGMCRFSAAGLILLGGDLPPDFSDEDIASLPPVLLGRGKSDSLFTQEKMDQDVQLLMAQGIPVTTSVFAGRHEWKKPFCKAAGLFLSDVSKAAQSNNGAQIVEIPKPSAEIACEGEESGKSQGIGTSVTVLLKDIAQELECVMDSMSTYLRRDTGEIIHISEEIFDAFDGDGEDRDMWKEEFEDLEEIQRNDALYVSFPTNFDIHEYSIMERFCLSLSDPEVCDTMCGVIHGQGAFRRFREFAHRFGIIEEWYEYKERAFLEIAREWCEDNDVPYQE